MDAKSQGGPGRDRSSLEGEIQEIVERETRRIEVSKECDGAFAVVDVDTLWRNEKGRDFHWKGRACKIYTKIETEEGPEWKMISQSGLLDYAEQREPA